MRNRSWAAVLGLSCLLLVAGRALAHGTHDHDHDHDHEDDNPASEVTYSGIGIARTSTSFDNVNDAVSLDSVLGFRIPGVNTFGIELNLGFTLIPGETEDGGCGVFDPCDRNTSSADGDFQALTLGAFGAFRSPGRFYGMGKLGYRYINSNLPELQEDRSGGAWGAGLGYRYNPRGGFVELAYTRFSDDLNNLGLSFGFGFGGLR